MLSERLDKIGDEECSQDESENIFFEGQGKGLFPGALSEDFNMFGHSTLIGLFPVLASLKPFSNHHSFSLYSSPLTCHSGDL